MQTTAIAIERITDAGRFESLAVAVLRRAEPAYSRLIETGTNASGKPIPAPVDGLAVGLDGAPSRLLGVQHTTCSAAELRRKWLGPGGDIEKAEGRLAAERERTPAATMTLVLTTNRVPDEELLRDVHFRGRSAGIDLDVWDRSRFVDVLDNEPYGQWLRSQYLGISQERLSRELLHQISLKSVAALESVLLDSSQAWIDREIDDRFRQACSSDSGVVFLIMRSGTGKTTACARALRTHVLSGACGLWLPEMVIEQSLTLEQAVQSVLTSFCPSLEPSSSADAIRVGSRLSAPMLLLVDDLNRTNNPTRVVGHVLTFGARAAATGGSGSETDWRPPLLVCPVLPQVVQQLPEEHRQQVLRQAITGDVLTHEEAVKAVQQRAQVRGHCLTLLQADQLARDLSADPLLIALAVPGSSTTGSAVDVTLRFIDSQCHALERDGSGGLYSDFVEALDRLARESIRRKASHFSWSDVNEWLAADQPTLERLRLVCRQRTVCQLSSTGTGQTTLMFRHDRVRDAILTRCLHRQLLDGSVADEVLAEPFYAHLLGAALAMSDIPETWIDRIQAANPLALFHSLRFVGRTPSTKADYVLGAIRQTLSEQRFRSRSTELLKWRMQVVLQDLDDPRVLEITNLFDKSSWAVDRARFRNGDPCGAARYCCHNGPDCRSSDRDALVRHVQGVFGGQFTERLSRFIDDGAQSSELLKGALYLAGFLADTGMAASLSRAWGRNGDDCSLLPAFIWAAAQCADDEVGRILEPMMSVWASLPEPPQGGFGTSPDRSILYHHGIHWGFGRRLPIASLDYFIRAAARQELTWPITQLLDEVDHPKAVRFIAEQMADVSRRIAGSGHWSPWLDTHRRDRFGRSLRTNRASAQELEHIWQSTDNDSHLRRRAFQLWWIYATDADVPMLRAIRTEPLYDQALRYRLELRDKTAVQDFRGKLAIARYRGYWWQFLRESWLDDYLDDLDAEFSRREAGGSLEDPKSDADWPISEIVARLDPDTASELLRRHWSHLKTFHGYVAAALFIATPASTALVADAVREHENPRELFEFLSHVWRVGGREERNRLSGARLDAILPYLDFLGEHDVHSLWSACNVDGFQEWRRKHLDARLSETWRPRCAVNDEDLFEELDRIAASAHRRAHHFWIERFEERGDPPGRPIQVVRKWLDARRTIEAFEVAASCVVEGGSREDLSVLKGYLSLLGEEAVAIYEDAAFGVFSARL
jgi:hypothetical protein